MDFSSWQMLVRCLDEMLIKQLMQLRASIQDSKDKCKDFIDVEFNLKSSLEDVYFNHPFLTQPSSH